MKNLINRQDAPLALLWAKRAGQVPSSILIFHRGTAAKCAKGTFTTKSNANIYSLKFLIRTWRAWRLGGENEVFL